MNAIEIEVFHHLLVAIAEEMGVVLRRSSTSANIKERLDFSCALTGAGGDMIAQASHIPVHLGSCHVTARQLAQEIDFEPGDVILLNDPYRGGTHLPDVTVFAPIFSPEKRQPVFGAMTRAHHSDVGGGVPGSMGSFDEIYKEGVIIPPVKIRAGGVWMKDIESFFLANVRTPEERQADLAAQVAATERGAQRIGELMARHGVERLLAAGTEVKKRARRAVQAVIDSIPKGTYSFEDRLDGPGTPLIAVRLTAAKGRLKLDFRGSDPMMAGALNAHAAVTLSSVFYAVRCLTDEAIPTNSGCIEAIDVVIPEGSIVGAVRPAAVAGGNVETSQRIVDVVFGALARALPERIPAASQGTMNSVSFGGVVGRPAHPFTYYETIAGGAGAGPISPGASGIHTHMTNTLNTPIEALERELPLRVSAYHLRTGSGGQGMRAGGLGIVREFEALVPMTATILSTRRSSQPYGLDGGGPGAEGRNVQKIGRRTKVLPASTTLTLESGDRLRIETPGGGGHGSNEAPEHVARGRRRK